MLQRLRIPVLQRLLARPQALLAIVAAVYALAQLILLGVHVGLGWDESIYVSQVSDHSPPLYFSAPRARGVTWLVAPVVAHGYSLVLVRSWLILLATVTLFAAFAVWLRVFPDGRPALAAALFSTLWTALFYGQEVMPDYWVAVAVVAAVGFLARAVTAPRTRDFVAAGVCIVVMALIRPSDSAWLVAGAGLVALTTPLRRNAVAWTAVAGGLVVGWVPWIVEAFTTFGGLTSRLKAASADQDGGLNFSLRAQARDVTGPLLCRPCTSAYAVQPVWLLWWIAGAALVVVAIVARRELRTVLLLATAPAVALMASYLFTIPYSAPRFFLPAYALLAIPAAIGLTVVTGWLRARAGAVAAYSVVGVLLAAQVASQWTMAHHRAAVAENEHASLITLARAAQSLGATQPCFVVGPPTTQPAFEAGCTHVSPTKAKLPPAPGSVLADAARDHHDAVVGITEGKPGADPRYAAWCARRTLTLDKHHWTLFTLPPADGSACPAVIP